MPDLTITGGTQAGGPVRRDPPVVLLCTDNPASRIIFHRLSRITEVCVVQEDVVSQRNLLRRRAARLGLRRVIGQVLFRLIVVPWLSWRGGNRVQEIKRDFDLDDRPMEGVRRVASMNEEETRGLLRGLRPPITVVCGTRVLDRPTLASLNGPVVNYHAGITPLYRGVHGGYWALAEGRRELVGSTIHLIDPGIDTGQVVAQATFDVTDADSFATYPYLHVAAALPALEDLVRRAMAGEKPAPLEPRAELDSKLRTHPTILEYLRYARAGVR